MPKPKPSDTKLYNKIKSEAKKKFKVYPSIYANSWLVREYKKRGGTYKGTRSKSQGILRWYKEKWINVCKLPKIVPCGRSKLSRSASEWKKKYPYCRPLYRVSRKTPRTAKEFYSKEIKRRCRLKKSKPLKKVR